MTSAYLDRFVDDQRLLAADQHAGESDEEIPYLRILAQTGRRIAELHLALAGNSELTDFAPEPITPDDVLRWTGVALKRADRLFDVLSQRDAVREADRPLVERLLAQRKILHDRLTTLLPPDIERIEYPPSRRLPPRADADREGRHLHHRIRGRGRPPLEERRRKGPAARDVAGLIRSIDYSVIAALRSR